MRADMAPLVRAPDVLAVHDIQKDAARVAVQHAAVQPSPERFH